MKRFIFVISVAVVFFLAWLFFFDAGQGIFKKNGSLPEIISGNEGPVDEDFAGEVLVGEEHLAAEESKEWVRLNSHCPQKGIYQKELDANSSLFLIAAGKKPTAGYEVIIKETNKSADGKWVVDLIFDEPPPGSTVLQAISYPYEVIIIKDENLAGRPVVFRDCSGPEPVEIPLAK